MTLHAENLSFAYHPGRWVFEGLSASFEPGLVHAVLGPNGSGKSTLLRCLVGLRRPARGSVRLAGRDVHAAPEPERAGMLAYVPQRPSVALGFSVTDVVALGCGPRTPGARARRAAAEALARVRLEDRADEPFAELSLGQQQRAVLARALAQLQIGGKGKSGAPQALLADEPTSAMDPRHALETLDLLGELARSGRIVIVVLHDLTSALRVADRAVLLDGGGRVAARGSAGDALDTGTLGRVFGVDFARLPVPGRDLSALVPTSLRPGR